MRTLCASRTFVRLFFRWLQLTPAPFGAASVDIVAAGMAHQCRRIGENPVEKRSVDALQAHGNRVTLFAGKVYFGAHTASFGADVKYQYVKVIGASHVPIERMTERRRLPRVIRTGRQQSSALLGRQFGENIISDRSACAISQHGT
jgi:hypothetical protein